MPTKRITRLAIAAAMRSPARWKVGAVAYRGSTVLGIGTNDMVKTSPHSPHAYGTRHAEFNALHRIPRFERKSVSIYVHRIGRDGLTHMAKPCEACARMLAWSEVKHIEWSEDAQNSAS